MIKLNKNIKKIITILMLAIVIISSLPLSTFASYITNMNGNAQFGVIAGSLENYGHELHYTNYDGREYILFCAQYGKTSASGGTYEYDTQFKIQLNSGAYQKIAEYIYFGYTMKYGSGIPTTVEAKRAACATQQFVWEYVKNNITAEFGSPSRDSWKNGYMSSAIYASWLNETESLYNNYHNGNVSFNNQTKNLTIGDTTTCTDVNGILASYPAFTENSNGVTFSHSAGSNDLIITVDENTNYDKASFSSNHYGIYRLMPNGNQYSKNEMSSYMYFHFTSGEVQDLIFSDYVDPTFFNFNIKIENGKINIIKRDSETGDKAQGDATLEGAVYKVYAAENIYNADRTKMYYSNGQLVATRTINSKGETEVVDKLPLRKICSKRRS